MGFYKKAYLTGIWGKSGKQGAMSRREERPVTAISKRNRWSSKNPLFSWLCCIEFVMSIAWTQWTLEKDLAEVGNFPGLEIYWNSQPFKTEMLKIGTGIWIDGTVCEGFVLFPKAKGRKWWLLLYSPLLASTNIFFYLSQYILSFNTQISILHFLSK